VSIRRPGTRGGGRAIHVKLLAHAGHVEGWRALTLVVAETEQLQRESERRARELLTERTAWSQSERGEQGSPRRTGQSGRWS
jgi:hypothetical protein